MSQLHFVQYSTPACVRCGPECLRHTLIHCRASRSASSFLCVCEKASATSSASCACRSPCHLDAAARLYCLPRCFRLAKSAVCDAQRPPYRSKLSWCMPTTVETPAHLSRREPPRLRRVPLAGLHHRGELSPLAGQRASKAVRRLPDLQPRLHSRARVMASGGWPQYDGPDPDVASDSITG